METQINFYHTHVLPGYRHTQVYNSPWQNFLANLCPFLNFCCSSKHVHHQKEHNKAWWLVHPLVAEKLDHQPSPDNKEKTHSEVIYRSLHQCHCSLQMIYFASHTKVTSVGFCGWIYIKMYKLTQIKWLQIAVFLGENNVVNMMVI